MVKVGDLKSIHVIMVAIVAFLLYYLIGGCGCSSDGFSVGGQSEKECIAKLEKLEEICCQDENNCPKGHPIKCDKSCEDHIQNILISCSNSPDIDKIKKDLSLSCKGEPCKGTIGGYEFCGEEAKKCMCDQTTKDNKNICRNLVGNKHLYNNDNCAQCKSIIPYWENKLEYCNPKEVWCGKPSWLFGDCGTNACPKNCDKISVSDWDGHGNRKDADICKSGKKVQCHCPPDYTPTDDCYIPSPLPDPLKPNTFICGSAPSCDGECNKDMCIDEGKDVSGHGCFLGGSKRECQCYTQNKDIACK